jgi:hypothetical protein
MSTSPKVRNAHVAIDDCSRLGCTEILLDERGDTVASFLRRAPGCLQPNRMRFW